MFYWFYRMHQSRLRYSFLCIDHHIHLYKFRHKSNDKSPSKCHYKCHNKTPNIHIYSPWLIRMLGSGTV